MIIFLLTLFIITIILLIPTILLQSNGADNGMLSSSNLTAGAFGAKSNEILVKFTSWLVTIFIGTALILSIHFVRLNNNTSTNSSTQEELVEEESIDLNDMDAPLAE